MQVAATNSSNTPDVTQREGTVGVSLRGALEGVRVRRTIGGLQGGEVVPKGRSDQHDLTSSLVDDSQNAWC
jgi:hypothetical protein